MKTTITRSLSLHGSHAANNNHTRALLCIGVFIACSIVFNTARAQGAIAPPTLGQETKGTPAIEEGLSTKTASEKEQKTPASEKPESDEKLKGIDNLLGNATIVESKRDSGQRYLIELKHSAGSKQYIEETDSDGKLESTSNDIEETPNLPKWKIGSW